MRRIPALHLASIQEIVSGEHLISVSVGPKSELIILSLRERPDYRIVQPGWASFAKNRASHPNTFTIRYQSGEQFKRADLASTSENFHFVQPLPDGNWLLARSRARNPSDHNAFIYHSSGQEIRSFHAGDAIQDMKVTLDGQIWVSYFDEAACLGEGIGGKGLASFDQTGNFVFGFDELVAEHELPPIDDCYAMNVASNSEVWIYYYSAFPLVKIVNRQLGRIWHDVPGGASGFAITENRALFGGFYRNPNSLFIVDLRDEEAEEVIPIDQRGEPITFGSVFGRNSQLYLITESDIYQLDLNSF